MAGRSGALILAAGASGRMGTPKALLAWGTTTLLESALEQARLAAVTELVVVLGPATEHLSQSMADAGVRVTVNSTPETGRSASIRIGSQVMPSDVSAVLVQSVDQPCSADILRQLFDALDGDVEVAVPSFGGRRGHPVCFVGRLLPELRQVTEHQAGLRSVVSRHAAHTKEVAVEDESVVWNLNDPAAYASARASAGYA